MLRSTIVLSGKVVVENVMFSWWITDGLTPHLTVSHPKHATETRPVAGNDYRSQARAIARAILTRKTPSAQGIAAPRPEPSSEATVVLGEDYRRTVADSFGGDDEGNSLT